MKEAQGRPTGTNRLRMRASIAKAQKPPRSRLWGGQVPGGGVPPATGHAGLNRGRLITLLASGVLFVSQLFGCLGPLPLKAALAETQTIGRSSTKYGITCVTAAGTYVTHIDQCSNYVDNQGTKYKCVNPAKTFSPGSFVQEDIGKHLSAQTIQKLGLASYWCEKTIGGDIGDTVAQIIVWRTLVASKEVSGVRSSNWVMDTYDSNAACARFEAWYAANKDKYQGHGTFWRNGTTQEVCRFWATPRKGKVTLHKASALPALTEGNDAYSLQDAMWGIWRDREGTDPLDASHNLTAREDGTTNTVELDAGTYWVREVAAPKGYELDETMHQVTVQTGEALSLEVTDQPRYVAPGLLVAKRDAQTGAQAQGGATLEGAEFCVAFYAGYHSQADLPAAPTRTWTLRSDAEGNVRLDADHKVAGDDFYLVDSTPVLPLGTLTIQETKPPQGYTAEAAPDGGGGAPVHVIPLTSDRTQLPLMVQDQIVRGGVALGKVSHETSAHLPQGDATLAGATLSLTLGSARPVVVDGTTYQPGDVVCTLTTDEGGCVSTGSDALPYGDYLVRETKAPRGYLPNTAWQAEVQIREDGAIQDLSGEAASVDDQVVRGGFHFNKVDGTNMERMAGTVFRVRSVTTGEAHIVVADENGIVDTETYPHSQNTNANDAVVTAEGEVDETALVDESGVWFSGHADQAVDPKDDLCALPYDTYEVEELPCAANKDHTLVTFSIKVHKHDAAYDMGTVDDKPTPREEPHIQTTLTFDGSHHVAPVAQDVTLVDVVTYTGLDTGKTYALEAELVDAATGEGAVDAQGKAITATANVSPLSPDGTAEVSFTFDASRLAGTTLVAYETLLCDGVEVADHKDLQDADQSVSFPGIQTTLTDEAGHHTIEASDTVELIDTVSYQGLAAGTSYTLIGTIHDKATGEAIRTQAGEPLRAEASFVPDHPSGTAEVRFHCELAALMGKAVVAFETLRDETRELTVHANIDDTAQTVYIPAVGTTLSDQEHAHEVPASERAVLTDVVSYAGIQPGIPLTIRGTLMDAQTGKAALDEAGVPITAQTEFVPQAEEGTQNVVFTVDTSKAVGTTLVAFETLCEGTGDKARVVTAHEDLSNTDQTVWVPRIQTQATDASDHDKTVQAGKPIQIVDTVTYTNLTEGAQYQMQGTLHDKKTGKALCDEDGDPYTSSVVFGSEGQGSVALSFELAQVDDDVEDIVVFERCLHEGREVATHADLNDADQTVHVERPEVKKTAQTGGSKSPTPHTGDTLPAPLAAGAAALAVLVLGFACRRWC